MLEKSTNIIEKQKNINDKIEGNFQNEQPQSDGPNVSVFDSKTI